MIFMFIFHNLNSLPVSFLVKVGILFESLYRGVLGGLRWDSVAPSLERLLAALLLLLGGVERRIFGSVQIILRDRILIRMIMLIFLTVIRFIFGIFIHRSSGLAMEAVHFDMNGVHRDIGIRVVIDG